MEKIKQFIAEAPRRIVFTYPTILMVLFGGAAIAARQLNDPVLVHAGSSLAYACFSLAMSFYGLVVHIRKELPGDHLGLIKGKAAQVFGIAVMVLFLLGCLINIWSIFWHY